MGIIVFLIDTSASMNQRTYVGTTLLDVARGAVDSFIKHRARVPGNLDRYMLVTFDEPPFCVKSGWKESLATFNNELKYMKASGTSTLGVALKETFDLLNLQRASAGTDTYGAGRNPTIQEPAVIVALTDVGRMHTASGQVVDQLDIPMTNTLHGSEMTKEPFRWDQRLFSVMLRIPGHHPAVYDRAHQATFTEQELSLMSDATGGKAYPISTPKMLQQCIESIAQKVHHTGVVLRFEKQLGVEPTFATTGQASSDTASQLNGVSGRGEDDMDVSDDISNNSLSPVNGAAAGAPRTVGRPTALQDEGTGDQGRSDASGHVPPAVGAPPGWHSCLRMIYVKHDPRVLSPRPHWPIPEGFWQDSTMTTLPVRRAHPIVTFSCVNNEPLTISKFPFDKYELEPSPLTQFLLENKPPNVCWQVFVEKSCRPGRDGGLGPPFGYLKTSVHGNCVSLFVMPYNYPVLFYLLEELQKQKFKPTQQLIQEFNRYVYSLPVYYITPLRNALNAFGGRAASALVADGLVGVNPNLEVHLNHIKKQAKENCDKVWVALQRRCIKENGEPNSVYPVKEPLRLQTFRNPYDILRSTLVDQVAKMRENLSIPISASRIRPQDEEERHCLPVAQTGNYQEHLKRTSPLRDLDTSISGENKTQLFGNPFRLESKGKGMAFDEANEALVGDESPNKRSSSSGGPSPKRRAGVSSSTPRNQRFATALRSLGSPASSPSSPMTPGNGSDSSLTPTNGEQSSTMPTPSGSRGSTPTPLPSASAASATPASSTLQTSASPGSDSRAPAAQASNVLLPQAAVSSGGPGKSQAEANKAIQKECTKEVRKPGRGADRVLEMLNEIRGSVQERVQVGMDIRKEALRFKRHKMVAQLDNWIQCQQVTTSS